MSAQLQLGDAIGGNINIALAFDSGYAMPAAVTLRSIAETVQGPITLYVFDGGLHTEDKRKIEESIPKRTDVTLLFMKLPSDSIAFKLGLAWARIDMMKHLPVERVLYLDADTLVRKDLRELWNTDLKGHALAAATDIVIPMGHEYVSRGPYFNSGVLLLDLVKIRTTLPELEALCHEMKDAPYLEQDPLNVHFRDDRSWLSLTWNAHGIGTVAKWHGDPDRQKLPLEQLDDPAIIHFIGAVHPNMVSVLHRPTQPFLAKPWGYAGAPGHPYAKDWWAMLEKTAWKGWRETMEYKEMCKQSRLKILQAACQVFDERIGWKE